jgi:hypothetical protein
MKITDFGLWFLGSNNRWSTTIPEVGLFHIYYDGEGLGWQGAAAFELVIWRNRPHIIHLKKDFHLSYSENYAIGRQLSLDDFEIVPNPDCNWDIFEGVL